VAGIGAGSHFWPIRSFPLGPSLGERPDQQVIAVAAGRRAGDPAPEGLPGPAPALWRFNAAHALPSPPIPSRKSVQSVSAVVGENMNQECWKDIGCASAEVRSVLGRSHGWAFIGTGAKSF